MGIKTWFRDLGRGIKRGFNKFVAGAGDALGGAATFLQRKAIPAIAGGAAKAAGLLGKAAPLLDAAGPEAAAAGAEAAQVAGKVGDVVGKFAKFIGSDAPPGRMATAAEVQQLRSQIPQGKSFFGIKPLPPAPAAAPAAAPFAKAAIAIKPMIGSNPASYSPSGIEAAPANKPSLAVMPGGVGGIKPMLG